MAEPFIWICLVAANTEGDADPDPRIRAWTANGARAAQLVEQGLDMVPLYRNPAAAQASGDSGEYARMRRRLVAIRNNPDCPAYIWTAIDSIIIDEEPRSFPASQPSPAATVDLTNHHNALKCPYCNPKGLQFAEPHNGSSAESASERREALAERLHDRALAGLSRWDWLTEPNKEDWRIKADAWIAADLKQKRAHNRKHPLPVTFE